MAMGIKPALLLGVALAFSAMSTPHSRAAIIFPKAPDGGEQIVRDGLKKYSASMSRYLQGFQLQDLAIGEPMRNYTVAPESIAAGDLLARVIPAQWIYPLTHGTNAVAAAELFEIPIEVKHLDFSGLVTSDVPNETLAALRIAGQLPQVQKEDCQVRRLQCPQILFTALWLHGKADDIIIPLPPARDGWNAYQPYSENEMIEKLKPVAKRRLNSPAGPLISHETRLGSHRG